MKLTGFEKDVIKSILINENIDKIPELTVKDRKYTGVGCFVYFSKGNQKYIGLNDGMYGSSIYIDLNSLEYGIGCVIYIENGLIDVLELFCHSPEEWQDPKEDQYSISIL